MAKKRKRKCEDPETWRRRIETWKRSGLGVTKFAAQEGARNWMRRAAAGVCHEQIPPSTRQRQGEAEERTQALSFVELTPRSTESPADLTCGGCRFLPSSPFMERVRAG